MSCILEGSSFGCYLVMGECCSWPSDDLRTILVGVVRSGSRSSFRHFDPWVIEVSDASLFYLCWSLVLNYYVTEPPNYDGPHVPVIVIMTSDSRTYVPHNLKGLLSSEQDPITGVLQYYNNLF
jgi:hypothetical protein